MCNSIIITSSGIRGMRVLWRSHRPVKLNGHLRANLWWTSFDSLQWQAQINSWWAEQDTGGETGNTCTDMTGGGARVRPDGLYNVIMNQSYWGTIVQTLYLQLDGGLNLRDLRKISGSIFYVGTFLSSNCPLSLSWQRVNTWNWATWTRGRGETLWRFSLLHFLG